MEVFMLINQSLIHRGRYPKLQIFSFDISEVSQDIELELQSAHRVTMRGSDEQAGALAEFTAKMKARLAKKASVIDQLMPSFPPVCRRLTPGPGYLEALVEPNVDVISTPIREIVEDGIVTEDGTHRKVEGLVCATGFDTSFTARYPIYGVNGVKLADRWRAVPETYMSVATDGFPNYFMYLGPNSGLGTGNLLVLIEKMTDYFTEVVAKIQRDDLVAINVKRKSVRAFVGHCDKYFERTVFTMNCRSWYKGGTEDGRVSALWPGMFLTFFPDLALLTTVIQDHHCMLWKHFRIHGGRIMTISAEMIMNLDGLAMVGLRMKSTKRLMLTT